MKQELRQLQEGVFQHTARIYGQAWPCKNVCLVSNIRIGNRLIDWVPSEKVLHVSAWWSGAFTPSDNYLVR
jgi:hypothetical protein